MFQGFAGAAAAAAPQGFFYPQVGRRKASVRGATTRCDTSPCRTELLRHKSYRAPEEEKKNLHAFHLSVLPRRWFPGANLYKESCQMFVFFFLKNAPCLQTLTYSLEVVVYSATI